MHRLFLLFFALLVTALPSLASAPSGIEIQMRNAEGEAVIQAALSDPTFWDDANVRTYDGEGYEEVRLKPADPGYIPMIVGEGGQDFDHDVVSEVVFERQDQLSRHMAGAKTVEYLGRGYDEEIGAEYTDAFFYLDLSFFYATYIQRMYRRSEGGATVLWFEKLDESFVDSATWAQYQARVAEKVEEVDRRWTFNRILEVDEIYGMFFLESGQTHESRITFVSKLSFGDDAGFIANVGSRIPGVIRSGLRSGFDASVAICKEHQARRDAGAAARERAGVGDDAAAKKDARGGE